MIPDYSDPRKVGELFLEDPAHREGRPRPVLASRGSSRRAHPPRAQPQRRQPRRGRRPTAGCVALDAPPGTQLAYGGLSMHVGGRLAEVASGETYKGVPHGVPTTHADTIDADLLAFIRG